jgi:transcriptional regulator with GAF, ATPase, and Fis domain
MPLPRTPAAPADERELREHARRVAQEMAETEARMESLREERADIIRELRAAGATWLNVADILGVTKQRAHKLGRDHDIA